MNLKVLNDCYTILTLVFKLLFFGDILKYNKEREKKIKLILIENKKTKS